MPRQLRTGNRNAAKSAATAEPAPWLAWPEPQRSPVHAIRWIETYCTLPKGHGAGERIRLANFQKKWIAEALAPGVTSTAMSVARGNGKSTLLASLALWAVFVGDESGAPQVPIIATTVQQAIRSVYGVALSMIRAEPELMDRAVIYSAIGATKVLVPSTDGTMFPVSSDVDGLQGLDPSVAVADELGFLPVAAWDSLLLASGKRPRSLVVGIGTPGLDKSNALWHLRQRVVSGESLPGFHYVEYAAPADAKADDEAAWALANPALAEGYMNPDALRTALALSPQGHFRVFRLGQWVDGVESWLGDDGRSVWAALVSPYDLVPGAPTWVGVDVGIKKDSTAVAIVQRRPDDRLHAAFKLWVPSRDEPVDVSDVMQYVRKLDRTYTLQGVSFDPRFFDVPAKMLLDEGLPMIEVPQSVERMTPAIGSTYEIIRNGDLSHDGDPVVTEQVLNAVARYNDRGFTLSKPKSRGRIDAAIALSLAVDLSLRMRPKKPFFVMSA